MEECIRQSRRKIARSFECAMCISIKILQYSTGFDWQGQRPTVLNGEQNRTCDFAQRRIIILREPWRSSVFVHGRYFQIAVYKNIKFQNDLVRVIAILFCYARWNLILQVKRKYFVLRSMNWNDVRIWHRKTKQLNKFKLLNHYLNQIPSTDQIKWSWPIDFSRSICL